MEEFNAFSLRYTKNEGLQVLDQRRLPDKEIWISCKKVQDMWECIKRLSVRGAPMIGCAAAFAVAQYALNGEEDDVGERDSKSVASKARHLTTSRPTAVNLQYCMDKLIGICDGDAYSPLAIYEEAIRLREAERTMCAQMAAHGAKLVQSGDGVLTHCNTGSLATVGVGTALGVIRQCVSEKKQIHVYVDETRPLLQGGRLTAYELRREQIPYTILCDNMAASLMRLKKIQRIFVGADRIASNGDFANKIGTFQLAIVANFFKVPFYVVAPMSTVDFQCKSGEDIPIEMRDLEEVKGASGHFGSVRWAPHDADTFNPAFDVTPAQLVSAWILDTGVYTNEQVLGNGLQSLLESSTEEPVKKKQKV